MRPPPAKPRRFTGKERDTETGFDYFGARYYRARIGRFTTVDPVMNIAASLVQPQRWNRYSYGLNNPFRYVDPDGRETILLQGLQTENNVFGHIAVSINGEVFSYWSQRFKTGPVSPTTGYPWSRPPAPGGVNTDIIHAVGVEGGRGGILTGEPVEKSPGRQAAAGA